jgi:hypothetical protein
LWCYSTTVGHFHAFCRIEKKFLKTPLSHVYQLSCKKSGTTPH